MRKLTFPARFKPLLIGPPIVIGIVVLAIIARSGDGPKRVPAVERSQAVRVIQTVALDVVPRVLAYGTAQPARTFRAVADVSGRVIEKHEKLEVGALVAKDSILIRIDPREYELAVNEHDATLKGLDAQLTEIDTREKNTEATLVLENRSLVLYEKELTRKKELLAGGTGSQKDVDAEERNYLKQAARVRDLENTLRLVPVERQSLQANRKAQEAKLETARLNLARTTIKAPFACRVMTEDVEATQFVSVGQVIAEAHGIEVAEINAQVPILRMRQLIPEGRTQSLLEDMLTGETLRSFGFEARVWLKAGDFSAQWDARVARIGTKLDPETRTLGVIVAIDKPYEKIVPGVRPPLVQGMFCEVELRGRAKPGKILIPRSAVHGREVYVVNENRLQRRGVKIAFSMQDFVCLAGGLAAGETIVVSDPVPAIEGMLLSPERDGRLEERLARVARGEADLR